MLRDGRRVRDDLLVVYVRPNGLSTRRVGISVPRRVGAAVIRNRIRRRLREICRRVGAAIPDGADLVIAAREDAAAASFADLEQALRRLLRQATDQRQPV